MLTFVQLLAVPTPIERYAVFPQVPPVDDWVDSAQSELEDCTEALWTDLGGEG